MKASLSQRVRQAWELVRGGAEAKAMERIAFGNEGDRIFRVRMPGSHYNYSAEAGTLWMNSAVAIGLGWIADNFPVPKLRVDGESDGRPRGPISGHPLTQLIHRPNSEYDAFTLWQATVLSYIVDGNAYWIKARGQNGRPLELWWRPHWQIEPIYPEDGSQFISHYEYRINGRAVQLDRSDVIHFRDGIDPHNERKGFSRIKALVREICADNEANTFTVGILKNMGVPGLMISPPEGERINDYDVQSIKDRFREEFSGDHRGGVLVNPTGARLERVGFSPEDLALDQIRRVPEARICAALRLPPQVLGLTSGEISKTYTNYAEARRAAYQDCLIPLQQRFAEILNQQLLTDLGDPEHEHVHWDYSGVDALREIQDATARNAASLFKDGLISRDEARTMIGLAPSETL